MGRIRTAWLFVRRTTEKDQNSVVVCSKDSMGKLILAALLLLAVSIGSGRCSDETDSETQASINNKADQLGSINFDPQTFVKRVAREANRRKRQKTSKRGKKKSKKAGKGRKKKNAAKRKGRKQAKKGKKSKNGKGKKKVKKGRKGKSKSKKRV